MESGNLLILQSGSSSIVGNSILYGLLSEALQHEAIEEIYGARDGFEGLLNPQWIALADLPRKKAECLLSTAGYALKHESDGFRPTDELFQQMVGNLSQNQVKWVAVIGNQHSIAWSQQLVQAAQEAAYPLQVLLIPQSNDNELPFTDHSLGYGSLLKFLNASLVSFKKLLSEERIPVGLFEIEGCKNGWAPAGALLSQCKINKNGDLREPPYLVCLPEQAFNSTAFLDALRVKLRLNVPITVVTGPQLTDAGGKAIKLSGGASVCTYLEDLIQESFHIVTYGARCNIYTQPLSHFISKQDQNEAIQCGKSAVNAFLEGHHAEVAILVRTPHKESLCTVDFVPFEKMATGAKAFPTDWLSPDGLSVTYPLIKYAAPLIKDEVSVPFENGLPYLVQL